MKKLIFLITLLCVSLSSWAYSFTVGGIYYFITSSTSPYTAAVIYGNTITNTYSDVISIPDSVTKWGTTYSVTSIGYKAFNGCTALTSVAIPSSVTSIGRDAFNGCVKLTSIAIPSSVTYIGYKAFNSCTALTTVAIPSSVTYISDCAFYGCTGLTKVVAKMTSLPTMGSSVFDGVDYNKCKLVVPIDKIYLYKGDGISTEWGKFTNIVEGPTITTIFPTSITATSAISGGVADDDFEYPITERGVCWSSIKQYPDIYENKSSNGGGIGTFTVNLKNLTPNTTYYIRGYVINSNGDIHYDRIENIYHFTTLTNTAVDDVYLENINIYPNPSNGILNIKFENSTPLNSVVSLYNLVGQKVYTQQINATETQLNVTGYNLKGVYLLTVENDRGKVCTDRKIVFK